MKKSTLNLRLYIIWLTAGAAIAGLSLPMFGDGALTWPEFRFAWVRFALGLVVSVSGGIRMFYDSSIAREKGEGHWLFDPTTGKYRLPNGMEVEPDDPEPAGKGGKP